MAKIQIENKFNTEAEEYTRDSKILYTDDNAKLQQILSNDAYLKQLIEETETKISETSIDCGYFPGMETTDPIMYHNDTPVAHRNMTVDGGSVETAEGGTQDIQLEDHMTDENAHPNIIVDGNEK